MKKILDFFKRDNVSNPPWDYYFLKNLDEKEYPRYLAKLFYMNTGEKLPLKYDFKNKLWIIDKKRCKTFNQKIQWIKLYGVTDLMRKCTDKVAVRDYVAEKIGEEYLKPVLQVIPSLNCDCHVIARNNSLEGDEVIQRKRSQKAVYENSEMKSNNQLDCHVATAPRNDRQLNDVSTCFDKIDWEKLPNAFVIKCNHGCKWQYIIKNKKDFLNNSHLFEAVKKQMTGWLMQNFCWWGGFELQYLNIEPKILIEPLMKAEIDKEVETIQVYCFSGNPEIIFRFFGDNTETIYNKHFENIEKIFQSGEKLINIRSDKYLKHAIDLCKKLSLDFCFVRIDWMIYEHNMYFEELTFTPYSGLHGFTDKKTALKLGSLIELPPDIMKNFVQN